MKNYSVGRDGDRTKSCQEIKKSRLSSALKKQTNKWRRDETGWLIKWLVRLLLNLERSLASCHTLGKTLWNSWKFLFGGSFFEGVFQVFKRRESALGDFLRKLHQLGKNLLKKPRANKNKIPIFERGRCPSLFLYERLFQRTFYHNSVVDDHGEQRRIWCAHSSSLNLSTFPIRKKMLFKSEAFKVGKVG